MRGVVERQLLVEVRRRSSDGRFLAGLFFQRSGIDIGYSRLHDGHSAARLTEQFARDLQGGAQRRVSLVIRLVDFGQLGEEVLDRRSAFAEVDHETVGHRKDIVEFPVEIVDVGHDHDAKRARWPIGEVVEMHSTVVGDEPDLSSCVARQTGEIFEEDITERLQVTCLNGIVRDVEEEEIHGRLWWSSLEKTRG